MELNPHDMPALFAQLGLPNGPGDIERFIRHNAPLADHVKLSDAAFWTPAQSTALKEMLLHDGDWAVVVDVLNNSLRAPSKPQSETL